MWLQKEGAQSRLSLAVHRRTGAVYLSIRTQWYVHQFYSVKHENQSHLKVINACPVLATSKTTQKLAGMYWMRGHFTFSQPSQQMFFFCDLDHVYLLFWLKTHRKYAFWLLKGTREQIYLYTDLQIQLDHSQDVHCMRRLNSHIHDHKTPCSWTPNPLVTQIKSCHDLNNNCFQMSIATTQKNDSRNSKGNRDVEIESMTVYISRSMERVSPITLDPTGLLTRAVWSQYIGYGHTRHCTVCAPDEQNKVSLCWKQLFSPFVWAESFRRETLLNTILTVFHFSEALLWVVSLTKLCDTWNRGFLPQPEYFVSLFTIFFESFANNSPACRDWTHVKDQTHKHQKLLENKREEQKNTNFNKTQEQNWNFFAEYNLQQ